MRDVRAILLYECHSYCKPDDSSMPALIAQLFAWRDIHLRWGRDTLGFGLYLFEKRARRLEE